MNSLVPVSWKNSLEGLRGRVMRLFDRWQPRRARPDSEDTSFWPASMLPFGSPAVDVAETDDEILVTADLPGLNEKDFRVEIEEARLILRGEKKAAHEEKRRDYFFSECSYGAFYRTIPLPCEVKADEATARYRHGELRLRLPKADAAKMRRRRITVH